MKRQSPDEKKPNTQRLRLCLLASASMVYEAPSHLCAYLTAISPLVDSGPSALCKEDSIVPLDNVTETALTLILRFLEYHHENTPEDTVKLEDYDTATAAMMEIESHKAFNTMWFGEVLQSGVDNLRQTVRAATYLSNPYLLRVLVSGTEQILLHGSTDHIRLFLNLSKHDRNYCSNTHVDSTCAHNTNLKKRPQAPDSTGPDFKKPKIQGNADSASSSGSSLRRSKRTLSKLKVM